MLGGRQEWYLMLTMEEFSHSSAGAETVVFQGWGQLYLDQDGVVSQTLTLCLSINLVLGSVCDHWPPLFLLLSNVFGHHELILLHFLFSPPIEDSGSLGSPRPKLWPQQPWDPSTSTPRGSSDLTGFAVFLDWSFWKFHMEQSQGRWPSLEKTLFWCTDRPLPSDLKDFRPQISPQGMPFQKCLNLWDNRYCVCQKRWAHVWSGIVGPFPAHCGPQCLKLDVACWSPRKLRGTLSLFLNKTKTLNCLVTNISS